MRTHVAAIALLLLTTGCGPDEESATPTTIVTAPGSGAETGVKMPTDVCSLVSATDLGAVVGGAITLTTAPVHSCDFSQDADPRARRGGFGLLANTAEGTYETYVYGAKASLTEPEVTEPTGLGGRATVAVGRSPMGDSKLAAGVVEVGDLLVTVNLVGGDEATLTENTADVLKLVAAGLK